MEDRRAYLSSFVAPLWPRSGSRAGTTFRSLLESLLSGSPRQDDKTPVAMKLRLAARRLASVGVVSCSEHIPRRVVAVVYLATGSAEAEGSEALKMVQCFKASFKIEAESMRKAGGCPGGRPGRSTAEPSASLGSSDSHRLGVFILHVRRAGVLLVRGEDLPCRSTRRRQTPSTRPPVLSHTPMLASRRYPHVSQLEISMPSWRICRLAARTLRWRSRPRLPHPAGPQRADKARSLPSRLPWRAPRHHQCGPAGANSDD